MQRAGLAAPQARVPGRPPVAMAQRQRPPTQQTGTKQLFECYTQGTVVEKAVEELLQRAQGVCGLADRPTYTCHERIYTMLNATTTGGPVKVRARNFGVGQETPIWQLFHMAPNEPERFGVMLRGVTIVDEIKGDPTALLEAMGFLFDFEYIREGYVFSYEGVEINIYHMYKLEVQGDVSSKALVAPSVMVEVSGLCMQAQVEGMAKAVSRTAEHLLPLAELGSVELSQLSGYRA